MKGVYIVISYLFRLIVLIHFLLLYKEVFIYEQSV